MGSISASQSRSPAVAKAVPTLTEISLRQFDAALPASAVPDELLYASPARELLGALEVVVGSLRSIDVARLARRRGWWSRLVGADLEARIELELACRNVGRRMTDARRAAAAVATAIQEMRRVLIELDADQRTLDRLITVGRRMLTAEQGVAEPELFGRLERRVANAMALHAANSLADAQLKISIAHAGRLIDRFADVDKLLFPVWQRHALSVAAAPETDTDAGGEAGTFRSLHERFIAGAKMGEEAIKS